mmetsp:Transcript_22010/g.63464  ORF Transcript_22010/g.63464 Transcript_22010/m.63464 type:complete len:112 (+) Transcript_22010:208-543(+)
MARMLSPCPALGAKGAWHVLHILDGKERKSLASKAGLLERSPAALTSTNGVCSADKDRRKEAWQCVQNVGVTDLKSPKLIIGESTGAAVLDGAVSCCRSPGDEGWPQAKRA